MFLDQLEEVAQMVGGRLADRTDPDLRLYHDALVQRFETAIALIHEVLGEALIEGGHSVRVGSTFTWVMRQSVRTGLISSADCDALVEWVSHRHVTSHRYSPATVNAIVGLVPDFVACGRRVLTA